MHWRLATVSVDRPRAAGYSLRAGRRALDSLAPSEAAKLFGDALEMLGSVTSASRSEQVRELTALVAQVGDLHFEFVVRARELNVAIELGEFGWADAALERLQAIAEQTRQPTQTWNAGFLAAAVMCIRGELEAAERLAEQALGLGQDAGRPDAVLIYGSAIVANRLVQGRGAEVIALIEQTVTEYPGVPAWDAVRGYTYCLSTAARKARRYLRAPRRSTSNTSTMTPIA
jgi:hypothetical protein